LSGFDFEIKHLKGRENRVADALSRKVQCLYEISYTEGRIPFREIITSAAKQDADYQQIQQPASKEK